MAGNSFSCISGEFISVTVSECVCHITVIFGGSRKVLILNSVLSLTIKIFLSSTQCCCKQGMSYCEINIKLLKELDCLMLFVLLFKPLWPLKC